MKNLVLSFVLWAAVLPCEGRIITVDDDGPADFNNIQAAINDANDGDVVIVAEGKYLENISFNGKNITLTSRDPNNPSVVAKTVIDAQQRGRVVTIDSGEDANCVLSGFTITNGRAGGGAGIYCADSNPTFNNCIISKNFGGGASGGMYCNNSSPKLVNCAFIRNSGHAGGGIYSNKSKLTLARCTFTDNSATWHAGAMAAGEGSSVKLDNCIFTRNSSGSHAGAISTGGLKGSAWTITNCTFVANSASDCGGAIYHGSTGRVIITNCIFWDNGARGLERGLQDLAQISLHAPNVPMIKYCCIQGLDVLDDIVDGLGNISENPIFADPNKGDYHLRSGAGRWHPKKRSWIQDGVTSPCIDAGDPNIPVGQEPLPNGGRINMGAYGGTAEASMPPYDWALLSDVTNDGTVDFVDFGHLAGVYTEQDDELAADFDRDGDVDYDDLSLLAEDWLKQTTWHE